VEMEVSTCPGDSTGRFGSAGYRRSRTRLRLDRTARERRWECI
jgi:hypothetical protein